MTEINNEKFYSLMHDKELCREMIRRIVPDINAFDIRFLKNCDIPDADGLRFNLYVDSDGRKYYTFYVEILAEDPGYIPLRDRKYHAFMGLDALTPGNEGAYVISICKFDPFNYGLHRYTIITADTKDPSIVLDDGRNSIFLNTEGTADDIKPELKNFLDFIAGRESDSSDSFINKLTELTR